MKPVVKNILVAGADGALGRVVVKTLAKSEFQVYGSCFNETAVKSLDSYLKGEGTSHYHLQVANLSSESEVGKIVSKMVSSHGSVDAVINCAGGFRWAKVEDTSMADAEFLYHANFLSCFVLAKQVLPAMKQRNFGRLVFVSSRASQLPGSAGIGVYAAMKAAINQLVGCLHEEVKSHGINVNAVLPSIIDTPANRQSMPKEDFSKWVTTDQLVLVILQLISLLGENIRGALVPVPGKI